MAFDASKLNQIISPLGDETIRFFGYATDDSETVVTGTDYFTRGARHGLRIHDLIVVSPIGGSYEPYIVNIESINNAGHGTGVVGTAPSLNADGGFSFASAKPPTQAIQTWFGTSAWKAQHSFHAETTGTHSIDGGDGADTSRWAMAITHRFDGSGGASGAPRLDGAAWIEASKRDWNTVHTLGVGEKGPVTTAFFIASNNEWGDTAAIVTNVGKIYGDNYTVNTDGAALQYEGTTRIYDATDGTTILRSLHCLIGYDFNDTFPSTVAPFPGGNVGFQVEPFTGDCSAAFYAQGGGSVGGGDFVWLLAHATNRNFANATFGITGPSHADGGGRVRGNTGSVAFPTYSFFGNTGTGMYSGGSGAILFAGNGVLRASISTQGMRIGASVTEPGAGSINIADRYFNAGNAVVGPRRTGWAVATGTATRTAFATTTVTLEQLAERVKALIDDFHSTAGHGLIGT